MNWRNGSGPRSSTVMYYIEQPVSMRLFFSDEALTIAQRDLVIAEGLTRYGYGAERIARGRAIYEAAYIAYTRRQTMYAAQLQATDLVKTLQADFRTVFYIDRVLVKGMVGKKRSDLEPFGLNDAISRKRVNLIDQGRRFYKAVRKDTELLQRLDYLYKIPTSVFDTRLERMHELVAAIRKQQVSRAEAQLATQRRRESMKELDTWMSGLIAIARVVFSEDRKQLEKLGISVKTTK